jgi:hypothetical protein
MANTKISALTAATTPVAGTEVLPIVQSSATVKLAISDLTPGLSTITAAKGGTGQTTYAVGDTLYASATTTISKLTIGAANTVLTSSGTAPQWSTSLNNVTIGATTATTGKFTTLEATTTSRVGTAGTAVGMFTVTGGRSLFGANSETYSIAVGYSQARLNSGQIYYIGATDSATPAMVFSNVSGTERVRFDTAGIVTMSAYGAGAATFSAAGVISSVSDETWKIKDGVPVDPDSMLKKLEPGYWYYNDEKKETFGTDRQLGFYAQNVNAAIGPEAAPQPEVTITKALDGTDIVTTKPWGYYDRSVLAITVMSLQKALAAIESLTARIEALEAKS